MAERGHSALLRGRRGRVGTKEQERKFADFARLI
jgi:hypothetical protein